MDNNQLEAVMLIIANAGNAKSEAMQALKALEGDHFEEAEHHLTLADEAINIAHNAQTQLLTLEAQGEKMDINLLTIHSQDHLMNTITMIDMAKSIVKLFKSKLLNP